MRSWHLRFAFFCYARPAESALLGKFRQHQSHSHHMDAKAEVRSVDRSAQLCEAHRQPSSCCCTLPRVSVQTRKAYGSTAGGCPGASIRKEQPLIQSYSHFFSREECTEVIELARAKGFRRAKTRSKTLTSGRTNSSAWLPHDASPALWQLTQRVADCVGLPTFVAEQWQVRFNVAVVKYPPIFLYFFQLSLNVRALMARVR